MINQAHEKDVVDYSTGEVETVNDNFVQLYLDNIDVIAGIIGENPMAAKIFMWLLKHMDKRNALVISQQALAEALGVHRNSVANGTTYLKEKKAVAVFKSGNTNIYAVNAQIAWKSDANGKKHAWFDAKVYIAEFEQYDDQPLFNTHLVGHAVKKTTKVNRSPKKRTEGDIKDFENASSGTKTKKLA